MGAFRRWFNFNRWYFGRPPWDTGVSPPELLAHLDVHAPGRALDIGCGTGTNAITMAQHGWQVTGMDFAVKASPRRGAKRRLPARPSTFASAMRAGWKVFQGRLI
jgi:cyclopropane fatty-acyl-phospholipid synthase-like methyltransferase